MKREKKVVNVPTIILLSFGALAVFLGVYVYFALNGPDYTSTYIQRISEGIIKSPAEEFQLTSGSFSGNKTLSNIINVQGIQGVDLNVLENYSVNYMSVQLYLYNLHNIPLTNDNPRLQVYLGASPYSIEIIKGEIYVKNSEIKNPDITIRTTLDEVAKIVDTQEYAKESFNSGRTTIETNANKITLLLKGYAKLYSMMPKF